MDVAEIRNRHKDAEQKARNFRSQYERAYELVAPHRNAYEHTPGNNKSPDVFDSSGALAADNYVNTVMNMITPIGSRFIDLKAGVGIPFMAAQMAGNRNPSQEDLEEIETGINEGLDGFTNDLFSYLNGSNMYQELGSGYYDAAIGTMVLLIQRGDVNRGVGSPIHFRALSPVNFSIEEGAYGEVSAVFRNIRSKARDILAQWDDLTGLKFDKKSDELELVEGTIFNEESKKWDYFLVQEDNIVVKREYRSNPYVVYRDSVIPGETMGRGPILKALPDLLQLNAAEELAIKSSQLSAYGAYTVIADDVINPNQVRVVPGAMIPVKRNAGPSGPSIAPIPAIGNVNHQMLIKQDLQNKIKRFMMDDSLPTPDQPSMTATEVVERVRNIQRHFGSKFGRISYELVQPLIQRSIDVLVDQNLVQLPEIFTKIDSFNVKMQIISPVSRMQGLQDVEAMTQTLQMLGGISPELIPQQVKIEDLGRWLADKVGAPLKFFKTKEEIMQEQAQAQMMQAQQAQAEAQAGEGQPQQQVQ